MKHSANNLKDSEAKTASAKPSVPPDCVTVHVRLTKHLARRIKRASEVTGRSHPDILRDAFFQWAELNEIYVEDQK